MTTKFAFLCDRCTRPYKTSSHRPTLCSKCQPHAQDWARPITAREIHAAAIRVEAALY